MLQQCSLVIEQQCLFITDNAANLVVAVQAGERKGCVWCIVHTLKQIFQYAVQDMKIHTYLIQWSKNWDCHCTT